MPTPDLIRPTASVVRELGLEFWTTDDTSWGRVEVQPAMLVPGTDVMRIGMLAFLVDMVAGQPPGGAVTPTTDLGVRVARPTAMSTLHMKARVLKAGATFVTIETLLTADDESEPFATSLSTFMNRIVEAPDRMVPEGRLSAHIDERVGARVISPGVVELDPHDGIGNAHHGTVLGGVTALLAELAAESLVADSPAGTPALVTGLDVRFLNRVKVGPVRAVARSLASGPAETQVGVAISDVGFDDRRVVYAAASVVPLTS